MCLRLYELKEQTTGLTIIIYKDVGKEKTVKLTVTSGANFN